MLKHGKGFRLALTVQACPNYCRVGEGESNRWRKAVERSGHSGRRDGYEDERGVNSWVEVEVASYSNNA